MSTLLYHIYYLSLFKIFFKYLLAGGIFLYKTFSGPPDKVWCSLKTEEHTPSCIWVPMAGVPAWIMPGPDEIAHSAASQRGREGRRKRWWKVCVTIKNFL